VAQRLAAVATYPRVLGAAAPLHLAELIVRDADEAPLRSAPALGLLYADSLEAGTFLRGGACFEEIALDLGFVPIENLPLRSYCVSANLNRADEVIHERGRLWPAVRASLALPGIYPPVYAAGELLIDGGALDNVPVDVMRPGRHRQHRRGRRVPRGGTADRRAIRDHPVRLARARAPPQPLRPAAGAPGHRRHPDLLDRAVPGSPPAKRRTTTTLTCCSALRSAGSASWISRTGSRSSRPTTGTRPRQSPSPG